MSHCGTPTFDNHLHCGLIVLKDIQHSIVTRMCCVRLNAVNVCVNEVGVFDWDGIMHVWLGSLQRVSRGSILGPSVLFGTE